MYELCIIVLFAAYAVYNAGFLICSFLVLAVLTYYPTKIKVSDTTVIPDTDNQTVVPDVIYDEDTTIVHDRRDGSGFLLPNVASDSMYNSIDGLKLLSLKYLQDNNLFDQPILVKHSYNGTAVQTIIFNRPTLSLYGTATIANEEDEADEEIAYFVQRA